MIISMTQIVVWLTTNDDDSLCVMIRDNKCHDHNTIYNIYTNRI